MPLRRCHTPGVVPREVLSLLQRVRRTVKRYEMLVPNDRVLVALSGGPDSVALLGALVTLARGLGVAVHAAHLNHGLRGEESLRDQHCAEQVAARLGVPCVVDNRVIHPGPNLEERARRERYAFLTRTAAEQGCTKIATGHTSDDQAETILMRLLRGAGSDGLAGIRAVREGGIVRPLIECSRAEVMDFLRARRLPFCEDSSNGDHRFLRNRVRHEVIPLLQSISPTVQRNLAAVAQVVTEELEWVRQEDAQRLAAAQTGDGALNVSAITAMRMPLRMRLVRAWLRRQRGDLLGLTTAHFGAVADLAQGPRPNGRVRLPGGQWVVREYAALHYSSEDLGVWGRGGLSAGPQAPAPSSPHARNTKPERLLVPGSMVRLASGWRIGALLEPVGETWHRPASLLELVADASAISGPLRVRTLRPGDRVQPLGLNGHRKLQDVFVDRKVPVRTRQDCPVVELDGDILWVPGVVRSAHALVKEGTRWALRLVANKPGVAGI